MKKLIMVVAALSASAAYANPTIYPSKAGVLESVVTNSQVTSEFIMDTHDDNAFYVLPPARGFAYASEIDTANANLGFCQDLVNIQSATATITSKLANLSTEQDAMQPALDAAGKNIDDAKAKLDAYKTSDSVAAQIATIDSSISKNTNRLNALYTLADSCKTDCDSVQAEIDSLQTENDNLANSKQTLIDQNINSANKIAELQATVDAAQGAYDRVNTNFENISDQKIKLLTNFRDLYAVYANLEAGTANIEYSSDWDHQVQLLSSLNPTKKFTPVSTHDVNINASVLGYDATTGITIPAIIDSVIDGRHNTGDTMPVSTFPEQLTAQVRLSLAGGCAITRPNDFHISGIEAGKVKLGISANYEFDSAYNTKIDCDYNEKEIYTKVMNSGSSGFLFWKKAWETIDISDIQDSTFKCTWDGQSGSQMTFADRRKFESDALNYVLAKMVSKYGTPTEVSPTLPPIPTSGLSTVGDSLIAMCGAVNIYCEASGWLMKSFDAIFGSGSSSASGSDTTSTTAHLAWDESLMYPVQGQTNFNTDQLPTPTPVPAPVAVN